MLRSFLLLLVVTLMPMALQAEEGKWEEGRHYQKLSTEVGTRSGDKIEVAEVFWYGCPHCYRLKPLLESWAKDLPDDVNLVYLPAALNQSWEVHARAFYVAQSLGVLDKVHDAFFEKLANNPRALSDKQSLADFFAEQGVDREKFNKTFDSFGVNAKLDRSKSVIRGARLTGVPALIVNGRYTVTAGMAGGHEEMLQVADHLIEQEREARQ
ncbi:thiol:disulfide interchange protein DsbA/DsbL [Hydrocarboniclastica marina]|uniref:Thiol:disulfide interchange protein n=1 Tax=Hydrocarboniclastica marina TaxID=2259620 RepID=A0A4P7XJJ1_9ALTE|nr:thiol:disulfide interchange protein DsbA/DsbL [Hydrocarboniclastica marina]QCF27296.1 thiol:disulfide interchange protein DsbA/DsbL [Hydrocarboniclastica marina]